MLIIGETVRFMGTWLSLQFFCKSKAVVKNRVHYQFKKCMPGIVPGTEMSKTWPCLQRAKVCESTCIWT